MKISKRLFGLFLAALAITLFFASSVFAEGSRDLVEAGKGYRPYLEWYLYPDNGSGNIPKSAGLLRQQTVKVYALKGETIYFGSSVSASTLGADIELELPDETQISYDVIRDGAGYIGDYNTETAGPRGVIQPNAGSVTGGEGYIPLTYEVEQAGTYIFRFHSHNGLQKNNNSTWKGAFTDEGTGNVAAWDVTVADKELNVREGRAYTDYLSLNTGKNDIKLYSTVYIATTDGYIYETDFNGMDPWGFTFFANNRGLVVRDTNTPYYHSVYAIDASVDANTPSFEALRAKGLYINTPGESSGLLNKSYPIFFNMPSADLPEQIVPKQARTGTAEITGFYGFEANKGYVGIGGYFEITCTNISSFSVDLDMTNLYYLSTDGGSINIDELIYEKGGKYYRYKDDSEIYLFDNLPNYSQENTVESFSEENLENITGVDDANPSPQAADTNVDLTIPTEGVYADSAGTVYLISGGDITGTYVSCGKVSLSGTATDTNNSEKTVINRVFWDGRDANGNILPAGTYFSEDKGFARLTATAKNGEYHIPLIDVENMESSITVKRVDNGHSEEVPLYFDNRPDYNSTEGKTIASGRHNLPDDPGEACSYSNKAGDGTVIDFWTYVKGETIDYGTAVPSPIELVDNSSPEKRLITGLVFFDRERDGNAPDGIYQPNYHEYPKAGVTVKVTHTDGDTKTMEELTTDTNGTYFFYASNGETVKIEVVLPDASYCFTTDKEQELTVSAGVVSAADTGITQKLYESAKLVKKWADKNPNNIPYMNFTLTGKNNAGTTIITRNVTLYNATGYTCTLTDLPSYYFTQDTVYTSQAKIFYEIQESFPDEYSGYASQYSHFMREDHTDDATVVTWIYTNTSVTSFVSFVAEAGTVTGGAKPFDKSHVRKSNETLDYEREDHIGGEELYGNTISTGFTTVCADDAAYDHLKWDITIPISDTNENTEANYIKLADGRLDETGMVKLGTDENAHTIQCDVNPVLKDSDNVKANKGNIYRIKKTSAEDQTQYLSITLAYKVPKISGGGAQIKCGIVIDNIYSPNATAIVTTMNGTAADPYDVDDGSNLINAGNLGEYTGSDYNGYEKATVPSGTENTADNTDGT